MSGWLFRETVQDRRWMTRDEFFDGLSISQALPGVNVKNMSIWIGYRQWMTPAQFLDAFAISRMAPGPVSLLVTLIGWQVAGFWGAVVATLSIFGPTAALIYGVAYIWSRNGEAHWKRALETGLRPVAAGMILAATYVLMRELGGGWVAQFLVLVSAAVSLASRISPLMVLSFGAALFTALHSLAPL